MKNGQWRVVWLLCVAVTLVMPAVAFSDQAYVSIVGASQGDITNRCGIQKGHENECTVREFSENLVMVMGSTGTPGKMEYRPVKILKDLDIATPLIARAWDTGEILSSVTISLWKPGPTGTNLHYMTYALENAMVVSITPSLSEPKTSGDITFPGQEIVSFAYQRLRITWEDGGIETVIDTQKVQ